MMDDMERYDPTPGSDLGRFVERARQRGIEAEAVRPKADADGNRRATVTFFGVPRRVPEVGERVEVRVEDGSWAGGYRAITGVTGDDEHPGADVVWISAEDEWNAAEREGRDPAGAPWPLDRMRPVRDEDG